MCQQHHRLIDEPHVIRRIPIAAVNQTVRLSRLPVLPGERFIPPHEVLQHVRCKARILRVKQGMRHPFAVRQHTAFHRAKKQLLCLRPRTEHNLRQRALHTAQQRRNDTLCCVFIIRF